LGTVTVTKMGLGVSMAIELLLETTGVDVIDAATLVVLSEHEVVGVGAGATLRTVVVTSWVMVGPGLTTSTVLVDLTTVVASAPWDEPPSTLITE
jgi:hypothetical protein